jgi:hypothetical protein
MNIPKIFTLAEHKPLVDDLLGISNRLGSVSEDEIFAAYSGIDAPQRALVLNLALQACGVPRAQPIADDLNMYIGLQCPPEKRMAFTHYTLSRIETLLIASVKTDAEWFRDNCLPGVSAQNRVWTIAEYEVNENGLKGFVAQMQLPMSDAQRHDICRRSRILSTAIILCSMECLAAFVEKGACLESVTSPIRAALPMEQSLRAKFALEREDPKVRAACAGLCRTILDGNSVGGKIYRHFRQYIAGVER